MNKIFAVGALLAAAILVVITTAATMTYALDRDTPSEKCSNNLDQHLSSAPSQTPAIQALRESGICHGLQDKIMGSHLISFFPCRIRESVNDIVP